MHVLFSLFPDLNTHIVFPVSTLQSIKTQLMELRFKRFYMLLHITRRLIIIWELQMAVPIGLNYIGSIMNHYYILLPYDVTGMCNYLELGLFPWNVGVFF